MPTASFGATVVSTFTFTGRQSHQSPTASCAKQPCRHFTPCSRCGSKSRKLLPQKRTALPLRFRLAALNGTQPKERRAPRLTRQRNRVLPAARRLAAYSRLTHWIVSAPIRSKYWAAPEERLFRSNSESHLGLPAKGRAALAVVSLHQFHTRLTSAAAAFSHRYASRFTFIRSVRRTKTVCVDSPTFAGAPLTVGADAAFISDSPLSVPLVGVF